MAGLLLILVVVNAGMTGWLYATVKRLVRDEKSKKRRTAVHETQDDGYVDVEVM